MGCVSCAGFVRDFPGVEEVVTLRLKESSTIPIEADNICPDLFAGRNRAGISALPAFYGRRKVTLGDLFTVEGQHSDSIVVEGDLRHVKKIGRYMSQGHILIKGEVGSHLGAYMRGGDITVEGNAADWVAAHMQGGRIWIQGNAGNYLGAAYPGEKRGVNKGLIVVEGNTGRAVGAKMSRGMIVVAGDTGEFVGANMVAGSILILGHLGARAGAGNKRGSIIALGEAEEVIPTYRYECRFQPVFLRAFLKNVRDWGLQIPPELINGAFRRYTGDITSLGKGEILIYDQPK